MTLFACSLFMIVMLIARPALCLNSVSNGVKLYAVAVLPSLLPFFFFTKILTSLGGAERLAGVGGRPVRWLFNAPPAGAYALILSLLSGYPVGARVVSDLVEGGMATREEAKSMMAFASTSGPLFVLGTVGTVILADYKLGAVVLGAHYLGAILNGVLFRHRGKAERNEAKEGTAVILTANSPDNILGETATASVGAVMTAGIFIVVFNLVADVVASFFALGGVRGEGLSGVWSGVIFSFIEMTRGVMTLSTAGRGGLVVAGIASAVSFGGLSVIMQQSAFLGKHGVTVGRILVLKATHAVITFGIALLLLQML